MRFVLPSGKSAAASANTSAVLREGATGPSNELSSGIEAAKAPKSLLPKPVASFSAAASAAPAPPPRIGLRDGRLLLALALSLALTLSLALSLALALALAPAPALV